MSRFVVWVWLVGVSLWCGCGPMATATVTPVLETIEISPATPSVAPGTARQLAATGTYSDGGTRDLTSQVAWASSAIAVATIDGTGVVHALTPGSSTVSATLNGASTSTLVSVTDAVLKSIAVTSPAASFAKGVSKALVATGTFTDNSQKDITTMVEWTSSAPTVTIAADGLATGVAVGTAEITATVGTLTASTTLAITAAELSELEIAPLAPHVPLATQLQLTATGTYTDGTTADLTAMVTWSSTTIATAAIAAGGKVTGVEVGTSLVTASLGALSAQTTLTVTTAALVSIAVTPATVEVVPGATAALVATGTYSDASHQDVTASATWLAQAPSVVAVSTTGTRGIVTGVAVGSSAVTASIGSISGAATATVVRLAVVGSQPSDGLAGVRTTTPIAIAFDEAALPSSLTAQTTAGACTGAIQLSADNFTTCVAFAAATATLDGSTTVATLAPMATLTPLTTYRVRVTAAAKNAGGDPMAAAFTQPTGFTTATDGACGSTIVISQVYGGGGNTGAPFSADFIELHNAGGAAERLDGLSIQYASATSATWSAAALPAVAIPAGGYYLIQTTADGANGAALPSPDLVLPTAINLSATAGKVALVATTVPLAGTCPLASTLDLIGYGTSATCAEAAPTSNTSSATSVSRGHLGCTDTNANSTDWSVGAVDATAPRSSATPADVCACTAPSGAIAELDYCNLQAPTTLAVAAGATSDEIYGRVFEALVTEAAGADPRITMQVGYGAAASDPSLGGWTWAAMVFNLQVANDEEDMGTLAAPATTGTYSFTTRGARDGVNWTYCDLDGNGANAGLVLSTAQLGTLTVH